MYEAGRRAFTSDGAAQNKFSVPGGECLRNEAVANTASIYSAYLLQVCVRGGGCSWLSMAARWSACVGGLGWKLLVSMDMRTPKARSGSENNRSFGG